MYEDELTLNFLRALNSRSLLMVLPIWFWRVVSPRIHGWLRTSVAVGRFKGSIWRSCNNRCNLAYGKWSRMINGNYIRLRATKRMHITLSPHTLYAFMACCLGTGVSYVMFIHLHSFLQQKISRLMSSPYSLCFPFFKLWTKWPIFTNLGLHGALPNLIFFLIITISDNNMTRPWNLLHFFV